MTNKSIRTAYRWPGNILSNATVDQVLREASKEIIGVPPIYVEREANTLRISYDDPHPPQIVKPATRAEIVEYIDATLIDGPLVSKFQAGDCTGGTIDQAHYSAYAFLSRVHNCSQEEVIYFDHPVRVHFPLMHTPIVTCSNLRITYNTDTGHWESDYQGPTHLAVYGTYTSGDPGPAEVAVWTMTNGVMTDSGQTIDLHFDWGIDPAAPTYTGQMFAEWFAADCRWRAVQLCCLGDADPPECGTDAFSSDFQELTPGVHGGTGEGDFEILKGTVGVDGLCQDATSPGLEFLEASACIDTIGLDVGESVTLEVTFEHDTADPADMTIELVSTTAVIYGELRYSSQTQMPGPTEDAQYALLSGLNLDDTAGDLIPWRTTVTLRITMERTGVDSFDFTGEGVEDGVSLTVSNSGFSPASFDSIKVRATRGTALQLGPLCLTNYQTTRSWA